MEAWQVQESYPDDKNATSSGSGTRTSSRDRARTNNRTDLAVSKMIEQLAGDWIDVKPNHAGYTQRYHLTVTDGRVHVDTYLDPWKLHETASRSSPDLIHVLSDGAGESVVWRGSNRISYKLQLRHWSYAPGKGTEIFQIAWVPQGPHHARGWTYVWRRLTQSEAILTRIRKQEDRVSRAGLAACEINGSLDIYQQEIATLHALLEEAARAGVPNVLPEPPGFLPHPGREGKRALWVAEFKNTLEYKTASRFTRDTQAPMPADPDINLSKRCWIEASEEWTDAVRHLARTARCCPS